MWLTDSQKSAIVSVACYTVQKGTLWVTNTPMTMTTTGQLPGRWFMVARIL